MKVYMLYSMTSITLSATYLFFSFANLSGKHQITSYFQSPSGVAGIDGAARVVGGSGG